MTRAQYRRGRRNRKTRYRKARFLNRKKPKGWLPPSIRAKLDANFAWIDRFCSLVPNPKLRIEVGKFDVAKMINPEIKGVDYQHGQTYGYHDVRYYVFARDEYTCQVCKKKGKILHTHHIIYRSEGGTDRADNLITVCSDCHTSENHKQGGILWKWMKEHKKVKQYKEPPFMNTLRIWTFRKYPNAEITYGSETSPRRKELGLGKTHYNDAIAITGVESIKENPEGVFFVKQFRIQNNILEFEICENEVKCLTFLDYFSAGKQFGNGDRDGDIMHRINMHHIDLLRKAFPNADVYHSEIIKDDIFEDIDLTFEKHISREKLPLDDMQEPRTMMVHLYEKSYVLPSRKAYCDQLITLRKLFVDVIKEYWQGIDDIHRVGKAYNAKMDQVSDRKSVV